MKFLLHSSVLNAGGAAEASVDRLVDRVAEEVHRIEMQNPDDLHASRWYLGARQTRRKILTSAVSAPPRSIGRRGPHLKIFEVTDLGDAVLADKIAHAELVIMVEDRESDGLLLDIVVEELGWPDLKEIWNLGQRAIRPAIRIDSASISIMPARIERYILDCGLRQCPPRIIVICDSDLRWPGDAATSQCTAVRIVSDKCAEHGIDLHVWSKRNAENYIPDLVFETVRDDVRNTVRVSNFNALLSLTSVQRDHLPVKDGLKKSERAQAILAGLYDASDEPSLVLLEERLFATRGRPLKMLFDERRAAFTSSGLTARDGKDELEGVLELIAQEL